MRYTTHGVICGGAQVGERFKHSVVLVQHVMEYTCTATRAGKDLRHMANDTTTSFQRWLHRLFGVELTHFFTEPKALEVTVNERLWTMSQQQHMEIDELYKELQAMTSSQMNVSLWSVADKDRAWLRWLQSQEIDESIRAPNAGERDND